MATAPRVKFDAFFTPDEWSALTQRSAWRGLWLVLHCWAVIGAAMVVGVLWPVAIPLAVLVIGTRQLGLFVLMHDAAHAGLHRNRKIKNTHLKETLGITLRYPTFRDGEAAIEAEEAAAEAAT